MIASQIENLVTKLQRHASRFNTDDRTAFDA
jgi:hypothetical protein